MNTVSEAFEVRRLLTTEVPKRVKERVRKDCENYPALAEAFCIYFESINGKLRTVYDYGYGDENEKPLTAERLLEIQEFAYWPDKYMWNVHPEWREFFPDRKG